MSSLLDIVIAGVFAASGTLMAPLPATRVGEVLAGTVVFGLALDAIKWVTFNVLDIR